MDCHVGKYNFLQDGTLLIKMRSKLYRFSIVERKLDTESTSPITDELPEADFPNVFYLNQQWLEQSLNFILLDPRTKMPFYDDTKSDLENLKMYFENIISKMPRKHNEKKEPPKSTYDPHWGWIMMNVDRDLKRPWGPKW